MRLQLRQDFHLADEFPTEEGDFHSGDFVEEPAELFGFVHGMGQAVRGVGKEQHAQPTGLNRLLPRDGNQARDVDGAPQGKLRREKLHAVMTQLPRNMQQRLI
jgi:hypothetical protein